MRVPQASWRRSRCWKAARRNESSSPPRLLDVDLIVVGSRGLGPDADRPVLVAARRSARRRAA
jgi:hypothetical protein